MESSFYAESRNGGTITDRARWSGVMRARKKKKRSQLLRGADVVPLPFFCSRKVSYPRCWRLGYVVLKRLVRYTSTVLETEACLTSRPKRRYIHGRRTRSAGRIPGAWANTAGSVEHHPEMMSLRSCLPLCVSFVGWFLS